MISKIVREIRSEVKRKADPKFTEGAKKYFKGDFKSYGVRVPQAREIGRKIHDKYKNYLDLETVIKLGDALLGNDIFEEGIIAFDLLKRYKKEFHTGTFGVFKIWLHKHVKHWAHCDELCPHLMFECVKKEPYLIKELYKMAESKNKWVRRGSVVSLIPEARKGKYKKEVFEIAEKLMQDKDDMVQKGVGWLLKETSKAYPEDVVKFLLKWKDKTSRLVLRYATEKLDKKQRDLVLR